MRREGFVVWSLATAGIALWMVHAVTTAVLAAAACSRSWAEPLGIATTVATAGATAAAVGACWVNARRAPLAASVSVDQAARLAFIGWFGVLIGLCSILLILTEGTALVLLGHCGGSAA